MREYAEPFGPVNAEQWALGVYRAANVVRAFEPFAERLEIAAGETQRFSVTPYFPSDVQSLEWSLDAALGIDDDLDGWVGLVIAGLGGLAAGIGQLAIFWRPPAS